MAPWPASSPTLNQLPAAWSCRSTRGRTRDKPFLVAACPERQDRQVPAPPVARFQVTHSTISLPRPNCNKAQNHLPPCNPCARLGIGPTTHLPGRKRTI